jgi:hypothetical protein
MGKGVNYEKITSNKGNTVPSRQFADLVLFDLFDFIGC